MMGYAPSEGKFIIPLKELCSLAVYIKGTQHKKNYDRNYYCDCNYVLCIGVALLVFWVTLGCLVIDNDRH